LTADASVLSSAKLRSFRELATNCGTADGGASLGKETQQARKFLPEPIESRNFIEEVPKFHSVHTRSYEGESFEEHGAPLFPLSGLQYL
jgi:hypothetical protein